MTEPIAAPAQRLQMLRYSSVGNLSSFSLIVQGTLRNANLNLLGNDSEPAGGLFRWRPVAAPQNKSMGQRAPFPALTCVAEMNSL